jgi:hypothetical protein
MLGFRAVRAGHGTMPIPIPHGRKKLAVLFVHVLILPSHPIPWPPWMCVPHATLALFIPTRRELDYYSSR